MKTITGEHTSAKVFTDLIEETAVEQIKELCNQEFLAGAKIRVMPDVHAGKGCTIGTTIKIKDKVVPNLVGVDVGCGVLTVQLKGLDHVDFDKLDKAIRENVPSGNKIHEHLDYDDLAIDIEKFKARHVLSKKRTSKSLGTLGGGNHFIELSEDTDENLLYLTIHTGSRYLGARIASYYQKLAYDNLTKVDAKGIIEELKSQGRHQEIQSTLEGLKKEIPVIDKDLAYLEGQSFDDYIHDMKLAQEYAKDNRWLIAVIIITQMNWVDNVADSFDTVHNYIDTENLILRKGAVSAQKGEKLIIPINMRDGSIIAVGKGNEDWNYSAPHGAGRVLSRTKAHRQLDLEDFKSTMSDVWSTSVSENTLDEAPMAYKRMEDIISKIDDTVDIVKVIKPIYNFKANEDLKFWQKKKVKK